MSAGLHLAAGVLALGFAAMGGAEAAVIQSTANQALTATPFTVSFGGAAAGYGFTAVSTGNGPGAAVQTSGTAQVSSFLAGVADFSAGASIDQTGELYSFSAFPTAATIPNSPADDFIGLAFRLADGLHYGYAEVAGATLVTYGYESTPSASILTGAAAAAVPEPASATLFLAGALGLAAIRRRAQS